MKRMVKLLCAVSLITNISVANESTRPNVLFIAIDDLRPELGCYGDTVVKSPNIDKLASQGMVFNRAYCQVPVCGASRASMMTGILPAKTRYVDYLAKVDTDTPGAMTVAQVFKEAGYTTLANGKIFHNSSDTAERSWSRPVKSPGVSHTASLDPATKAVKSRNGTGRFYECVEAADNAYGDGIVAERTIADLQKFKESGEPFFLACGFIRPHLPFYAPKKYWDLYDEASIPLADNPYRPKNAPASLRGSGEYKGYGSGNLKLGSEAFNRKMRHGYFASTSYADKLTGDVLSELESLGLADNTIVVIWGDHGWHLGEHDFWGKHNTLHNALRIPLIVKVPGKMAGAKSESLVAAVDLFPTLCTLASLEIPPSVQGKSFEVLLDDPEQKINEAVYTRFKAADNVVTDRYSYTLYENGEEMLFDLKKDPQENQNVANNPEYSKTLQRMRSNLKEQMAKAQALAL
ncbi:sulfatase [Pontiellaceae bacterium B12227]|nr:sulfatase [Pontiellaceae bacterium B12227]